MSKDLIDEGRKIPDVMAKIAKLVPTMAGWCPVDKALIMATYIIQKKPDLVVELGIFGGRSLIPMAMACKTIGKGRVIGIDPWTKDAALEGENSKENEQWWSSINLEETYKTFIHQVLANDVLDTCFWHRMKSEEAIKLYQDNTIGFLHCDSNHSEKVSLAEIDQWSPKVKNKGIWIMDDTDWPTMQKAKAYILTKGFRLVMDYHKWMIYEKFG